MLPEAALTAFASSLAGVDAHEAGEWLQRAWSDARARWPTFSVAAERFALFVAERVAGDKSLEGLRAADLYLAFACLERDPAALAALDELLAAHAPVFRGFAGGDDVLEEAKQVTRQILLVGATGKPGLAGYAGRGDFIGWLKITLGREVSRIVQRGHRQRHLDTGEIAAVVAPDDDPETAFLKTHYREEFKQALSQAIARLDETERRLLRYAVIEQLTVDQIGVLLRVHRATAARQVARARQRLVESTHELLRERLRIDTEHLQSILRLVESELDVSLRGLLG